MNAHDAADLYRRSTIENAPPLKIVRLLYGGAIRFLEQALREQPSDPRSGFVDRVHRAERIVGELRLALDPGHAPEVSENLERLYVWVENALARASVDRDLERVRDAKAVLERLADAWNQLDVSAVAPD